MGFGAALRNIQYDVTDTATGAQERFTVYTDLPGGMFADWARSEYWGAMSLPGAWRAAIMLSDQIGKLTWSAFEDDGQGNPLRVPVTPDYLEQPSPPDSSMTTMSSLCLDLVWHGNAVEVVASRDAAGNVSATTPVPADAVFARRAKPNESGYREGQILYDVGGQVLTADEVVHTKGPCRPGSLRGLGVLECHRPGTIALALEQARQASDVANAAVPTGVLRSLVPDLTGDEAAELKGSWQQSQRARTVAVLNSTTEYMPLAWNPSETQLLDARKFSLLEIALIFGVDPYWLGASTTSEKYSNVEQEAINFVRYSAFAGHLARFEATRSLALPPGQWCKANLDALLRADTLARYQAYQLAISSGWLTADEVRGIEGRPPLSPAQLAQIQAMKPAPPAPPAPAGEPDGDESPAGGS